MSNKRNSQIDPNRTIVYQIRLKGHLGDPWAAWFGNMTMTLEESGDTLLSGPVADQAELHGLLRKVRDLGIPLLSVIRLQNDRPNLPDVSR